MRKIPRLQSLILILAVAISVAGIIEYKPVHDAQIATHSDRIKTVASVKSTPRESVGSLRKQLNTIFAGYPNDTVSVSLIDIASNKQYDFGSNEVMRGASTTKIITAIDYLHQVELGRATLNQDIDGESAESLLQTMIEEQNVANSDAAWYDFIYDLSYDQITDYGQSIGLSSFNGYYNTLTAHDEALVLQKLYEGKLLNHADTKLLLSFMQQSSNNDLIPAALPSGAIVYHKYGYLYGFLHDTAIVTYKGKTFVLVIFTDNSSGTINDYSNREQLFHAITRAVIPFET